MNNVSLIGRFTRDPELSYTQSGKAVANFTLAIRNPFRDEADFIPCVAWGAGAELICENHGKGHMIGVDGRMQSRQYEREDGTMVYPVECNVEQITLIDTFSDREPQEEQQQEKPKRTGNNKPANKPANNKPNTRGNTRNK